MNGGKEEKSPSGEGGMTNGGHSSHPAPTTITINPSAPILNDRDESTHSRIGGNGILVEGHSSALRGAQTRAHIVATSTPSNRGERIGRLGGRGSVSIDHNHHHSDTNGQEESFSRRRFSKRRQRRKSFEPIADPEGPGIAAFLLTALSFLLIVITVPFSLCLCIKVVAEYERAVIFRLGRLRKGGSKGPGIFTVIPCIDTYRCVDLRTVSFDVPPQEMLSRDSVTVTVDAVVFFNIIDAEQALCIVDDFSHSTRLLAATTLRNVLGTKNLAEILSERETISHTMQSSLDEATDPWGVKVERVEIKDVRLPVQLQRAMAAEAEAAREARAKVIAAEGEQKASRALKEAADVIQESPSALQLRYLQTLTGISAEKNSTIIFPLPIDLIKSFMK
ncbi:band 7 protein AGAP004871 isoform X3 [Lepeophtheirus salmonis]